MAKVTSAGILLHRGDADATEVFIAHMGGPYWARKDEGAWSVPKGEYTDEDSLEAARREFREEIGVDAPPADYELLGDFRQKSGKVVRVFTAATDAPLTFVSSNMFELEWPPRSGTMQQFAEIDDARWMTLDEAETKLVGGQRPVVAALRARLGLAQAVLPDRSSGPEF